MTFGCGKNWIRYPSQGGGFGRNDPKVDHVTIIIIIHYNYLDDHIYIYTYIQKCKYKYITYIYMLHLYMIIYLVGGFSPSEKY
jgi:hypothetical protein